ncbi:MAG: flagellar biosynthesis anti-sigma factor FlgM [Planctomycetota bacterium]|nr:flagellar biosynthesis anti-sigma factor FlgM [Planctomycetota bacterium]
MRINGFGELENIHKALRKDESALRAGKSASAEAAARSSDEVAISLQAKLMARLRQIPDVRPEEIRRILAKIEEGTLTNSEALDSAIERMLRDIV